MKTNRIFAITTLLLSSLAVSQAQFTTGDLVVLREGAGSAPLSSAGTAIYLDEYSTSGVLAYSLAIPSTGSSALVNSGSATSEGALNLSANGQYLVFAGYNAAAGTPSIVGTTAAAVPRGVATVDASGNYTLAATTSSSFSANNIRAGATDGTGNYWAVGANSGAVYLGTGTPGAISTTVANNRVIQDIGGNLYFSTGSGTSRGIYKISGTPTSGANTAVSLINNGGNASPYDFVFNPGMTIAYVADSSPFTNSTTIGGVEKWSYNGSAWVFDYSLSYGTNGAVGLAVNFSGANPTIYATSGNGNSLFDIVDTGSSATGTLLATAAANEAFRGLEFTVPEPSACALIGLGLAGLWSFQRRNRKS
jgi:PEP-CTERM motif